MQPSEVRPMEEPSSNIVLGKQEHTKLELPLHVILSLLKPDELAKLRKYIATYLTKHSSGKVLNEATPI